MVAVDRLSDLPEGILMLILRRMEIREAIQTSVLSKQWNRTRLWTQLPSLYINADPFDTVDAFQFFLIHLFTHYDKSKLYTCRLKSCDFELNNNLFAAIFDYLITNQVSHLWIQYPVEAILKLPLQLSKMRYLETLELGGVTCEFPIPFCSRSLRRLRLDGVNFENDFLMHCPNLEYFRVMDGGFGGLSEFVIAADKLEYMDVEFERIGHRCPNETMVLISASRLEHFAFQFICDSTLNISMDRCPDLKTFWLDIGTRTHENTKDMHNLTSATYLVNFLKEVGDAKSLTLSADVMMVLAAFTELLKNQPSPFYRLETFKVYNDCRNQNVIIPPEVKSFLIGGSPSGSEILKGLEDGVKETSD
ncbi:hypothetical protein ACFE04_013361 [Oxalis oulophora]